jgi:hypothetical protein
VGADRTTLHSQPPTKEHTTASATANAPYQVPVGSSTTSSDTQLGLGCPCVSGPELASNERRTFCGRVACCQGCARRTPRNQQCVAPAVRVHARSCLLYVQVCVFGCLFARSRSGKGTSMARRCALTYLLTSSHSHSHPLTLSHLHSHSHSLTTTLTRALTRSLTLSRSHSHSSL